MCSYAVKWEAANRHGRGGGTRTGSLCHHHESSFSQSWQDIFMPHALTRTEPFSEKPWDSSHLLQLTLLDTYLPSVQEAQPSCLSLPP